MTFKRLVPSPLDDLMIVGDGEAISALYFPPHPVVDAEESPDRFQDAAEQLREWFEGTRRNFDLTLRPLGTPFQQRVWSALNEIPYGKTASYFEIATRAGNPRAARPTGQAIGSNPLSIIVPCHRVIGANGSLTGYGGGMERKRWLLDHERRVAERTAELRS